MPQMNRRTFLKSSLAFSIVPRTSAQDHDWRTFEIVTRVEVQPGAGVTRAWLPLPSAGYATYQRVLTQRWRGSAPVLRAQRNEPAAMLLAEWPANEAAKPEVELILQIATRDRVTDWSNRSARGAARPPGRYLAPIAPDARSEAQRITGSNADDVGKARAIYEWAIDQPETLRGPAFVRLSRAAGVPARIVSGLRLSSGDVTTAQYERAEFHSRVHGWVPVDPGAASDAYTRRQMFGMWKGDWIALNESSLMRPRAEASGRPLKPGDPAFHYTITARQVS